VVDPLAPVHKLNLVDTCGRCHGNASVMGSEGVRADVVQQYSASVHGVALLRDRNLASPGCTDCHGSHGAKPPRVEDVAVVCGQCHTVIRRHFEQSPHLEAARQGIMKECVTCHGNHHIVKPDASMLLGTEEGHCGSCHAGEKDPGAQTAQALHKGLAALEAEIDGTERRLREAAAVGSFIEDEEGYLDEARATLAQARSLTHTVSRQRLDEVLNSGSSMVHETLESLEVKGRAHRDRKILVSAFAFMTLVFIGILLIRRGEV
jgi:predicted CXXCH cytochrome family protein